MDLSETYKYALETEFYWEAVRRGLAPIEPFSHVLAGILKNYRIRGPPKPPVHSSIPSEGANLGSLTEYVSAPREVGYRRLAELERVLGTNGVISDLPFSRILQIVDEALLPRILEGRD